MRPKLSIFTDFANTLFPHELEYLMAVQNFSKPLNLKILKQIYSNNTSSGKQRKPFDESIDKRTYSYLKKWITETLLKIDVDYFFDWLIETEKKILTDVIVPSDETVILSNMNKMHPTNYNYIRFYELLQYYRDYLVVRSRTRHNKVVTDFLEVHHEQYHKLKNLNIKLDDVTARIVKKTEFHPEEKEYFENFLWEIFFDETLDGYTRYRAVVRLTIHYYNNREFEKQAVVYQHLDGYFKTPVFYSKRILSNYYANRTMMHSKLNELEEAEKYGYLSIQNKNSDYLFYLINLCGVLLKQEKNSEALKLMRKSIPELKNTNNNYYKIGFASFYILTFIANKQIEKAVHYASQYFQTYRKEIFEHRWHLYFTTYLFALINAEKYDKVVSICKRYNLLVKEKQRIDLPDYLPIIENYYYLSEYMEGKIDQDKLISSIVKSVKPLMKNSYRSRRMLDMIDELGEFLYDEMRKVKTQLLE
ncbi:MAG: hypothetical protein ACOX59_02335 [Bacteroidales bacterium]|jgi:hypothetical protein|nr:hypothetical protein [Bacteroidales bacterium]HNZ80822.1 hypothetical protein [Bacteroidales bacterium]HPB35705.1 hypothetical protein [Bacteroidales bacterium]HPY58951.1 hypothetical protein [Bacteroidales bacterium]HQB70629.1 hypothetical protein [Bacteroidales bacterium]